MRPVAEVPVGLAPALRVKEMPVDLVVEAVQRATVSNLPIKVLVARALAAEVRVVAQQKAEVPAVVGLAEGHLTEKKPIKTRNKKFRLK